MKMVKPSYYPIYINVSGKTCVVVGGGQVALRKVKSLLDCGANITVISPDLCPELHKLAENGKIAMERNLYQPGDLTGALLVIAATDEHSINLAVVKEANEKGIMVNVVDDPADSDFIVPSCLRRGDITIAVSTSGQSPALARKIRVRLEKEFAKEYGALAILLDEVRLEIKSKNIMVTGDDWQKAIDLDLMLGLLQKGDKEKARAVLLHNLKMSAK